MNRLSPIRSDQGYTLVELMIVILILGILAAVALPQVVGSSLKAKESVLKANLMLLRDAIERYKLQHNDTPPKKNAKHVEDQLTGKTDIEGKAGTDYGPYLRNLPTNPLNGLNDIKIKSLPKSPNDKSGWYYDKDTGEIRANSSGADSSGVNYVDM